MQRSVSAGNAHKLGLPKLAFEPFDGGCTASLTIPLGGKALVQLYMEKDDSNYLDKPYKTRNHDMSKDTYNLKMSVPVKSVAGDVKVEDIDRKAQLAQHVIALGECEKDKAHIILHFSSEKAIYSIETNSASNSMTATATGEHATSSNPTGSTGPPATTASSASNVIDLFSDVTKDIQKWFSSKENVNAIDYRLATGQTLQDPSDFSSVLKPKSFVFRSNGDVLCIYIQTQGSGAQPGDTEANFPGRDGSTNCPIPSGCAASIIVAHRLLHEKVFLSQLQKYQRDNGISSDKVITTSVNANGFTYGFYVKGDFTVNLQADNRFFGSVSLPQITVYMDDDMTTLEVEETQATFDYSNNHPIGWGTSAFAHIADLTVKIPQSSDVVTVSEDKNIAINLSIMRTSFKLDRISTSGGVLSNYLTLTDAQIDFQDIYLRLPELNFIAVENVLAPGATIVKVKSINIPYDMIFSCELVDHITA